MRVRLHRALQQLVPAVWQRGYRGMQFKFVVSANVRDMAMWQSRWVCELPASYRKFSFTLRVDMLMRW